MAAGEELARVEGSSIRLAESARTVNPGELLVLDNRGRELTKWSRLWMQVRFGLVLAVPLSVPVFFLELFALPVLPMSIGMGALVYLALVAVRRARWPYYQAMSRLTTGDIAGCEALLVGLKTPARGERARMRMYIEGWLAYSRGQDRRAIEIFERGLGLLPRRDVRAKLVRITLVDLYVRSGMVAQGRALRDQLGESPPGSELIEVSLASVDLALAIAEGNERGFAEATIDRWVRLALEINNTNLTLAALARVVATRGDDELADHLAREARDRFCWCPLECSPVLARWVDERIAQADRDAANKA